MPILNKKIKYKTIIILTFCLLFFPVSTNADERSNKMIDFEKEVFIGLTEVYYGQNYINSNIKEIHNFDRYQEKVNIGRINFYLKGKIKGKYLLTVWLDSGEKNLKEIFKNLGERKKVTPFRKIDPEKYYPVYGDNSSTINEVNTSGSIYVALIADKFKVLWGDFKTEFKKNNLIDFDKNIYGLNILYKDRLAVNSFLHTNTNLNFQDKIKLTGGIIYYLRKDNIAVGSELLTYKIKDIITSKVIYSKKLIPGQDYKINYLQGRVILKERLKHIEKEEIIDDQERQHYLLASYQLNENNQESRLTSYGVEASYQLTEDIEIAVTNIRQANNNNDYYNIFGYNINFNPNNRTLVNLNWARSKNILYPEYFSDDGGISYVQRENIIDNNTAAWELELKKDITNQIKLNTYYTKKDKGFSSGSDNIDKNITAYGIKLKAFTDKSETNLSYQKNKKGTKDTEITSIDHIKKYNKQLDLEFGLENNYQKESKEKSLTGAVGFDYQLDENKNIFGSQQMTTFNYKDQKASITTIGGKLTKDKLNVRLAGKVGTKNSLEFSTSYHLNKYNKVYTNIDQKLDEDNSNISTFGIKSKLNDKTSVYSEYRIDNNDKIKKESVIGLDYNPLKGLVLNLDFTNSNLKKETGNFNRNIISLNGSYKNKSLQASGGMEYREDKKTNNLKQFILNSKLKWQYNKELTLLSKIEYLKEDEIETNNYYKSSIGFSYRPIENDLLNILGKYSYLNKKNRLEDIDNLEDYPEENIQILSLDLIYDLSNKWQLTEKIAYKGNQIKMDLNSNNWKASKTYLWVNRLNYKLKDDLEIFGEYRILNNTLVADKRSGILLGGYKRFPNDMKAGIGYNFTDFNDNLANLNYQSNGWFFNIIKVW